MISLRSLLDEIARCLPEGGQWCTLDKAETLAAMIVALRPRLVVEIGVWEGGSLIPMLLALRNNGFGRAIAIDPWSAQASVAGEVPANARWWGEADHERALRVLQDRIDKHALRERVEIWRSRSDDATPPERIDLLHIDGNHTDQALRDVDRYARQVSIGGVLVLDDLDWEGGAVQKAHARALELGFFELYPLGTGLALQRRTHAC